MKMDDLTADELAVIYHALVSFPQARRDRLFDAGSRAILKVQVALQAIAPPNPTQPPEPPAAG